MKCKACGIKRFPMWYSDEYCSRSCALQRLRELREEYQTLLEIVRREYQGYKRQ